MRSVAISFIIKTSIKASKPLWIIICNGLLFENVACGKEVKRILDAGCIFVDHIGFVCYTPEFDRWKTIKQLQILYFQGL